MEGIHVILFGVPLGSFGETLNRIWRVSGGLSGTYGGPWCVFVEPVMSFWGPSGAFGGTLGHFGASLEVHWVPLGAFGKPGGGHLDVHKLSCTYSGWFNGAQR